MHIRLVVWIVSLNKPERLEIYLKKPPTSFELMVCISYLITKLGLCVERITIQYVCSPPISVHCIHWPYALTSCVQQKYEKICKKPHNVQHHPIVLCTAVCK